MDEQERVPATVGSVPVIVVDVAAADAPEEGARMSITQGVDAEGSPRVTAIVPDPDGEWVVAGIVPSHDPDGYVSVYLNNPSRLDLTD